MYLSLLVFNQSVTSEHGKPRTVTSLEVRSRECIYVAISQFAFKVCNSVNILPHFFFGHKSNNDNNNIICYCKKNIKNNANGLNYILLCARHCAKCMNIHDSSSCRSRIDLVSSVLKMEKLSPRSSPNSQAVYFGEGSIWTYQCNLECVQLSLE